MQEIRQGITGKIAHGRYQGQFIKVIDDSPNTSGYVVFRGKSESLDDAYDDWMQTWELVEQHFMIREWEIEWLESAD